MSGFNKTNPFLPPLPDPCPFLRIAPIRGDTRGARGIRDERDVGRIGIRDVGVRD